ncbi:MAG: isoprenylcysteine carboxylmethyltransferase family protein [Nitrospinaceae bacterium]
MGAVDKFYERMMVEPGSLSSNRRFALNVFVPLLYFLPLITAYFLPKNFGFGYPGLVPVSLGAGFLGWLLWVYGMLCLGKSLAVLPGSDTLVTRGIYNYIRHPMYIGIVLTLFGLLFACGSVLGMIYLFIVVIPLNIYRARKEEEALAERFGESYRAYCQRTWF